MKYGTALFAVTALAALCSAPAFAMDNATFVKQAIGGDLAEVKLGELAQSKSQNPQVQNFGQTLVTDHNAHKSKAETIAQQIGVTPPSKPPKEAQQEYDKLSKMSGNKFDQAFVDYMVKDHKKDVKEFSTEAKETKDQHVAQFASETIPTLQKHLQIAENLQKSMK